MTAFVTSHLRTLWAIAERSPVSDNVLTTRLDVVIEPWRLSSWQFAWPADRRSLSNGPSELTQRNSIPHGRAGGTAVVVGAVQHSRLHPAARGGIGRRLRGLCRR